MLHTAKIVWSIFMGHSLFLTAV